MGLWPMVQPDPSPAPGLPAGGNELSGLRGWTAEGMFLLGHGNVCFSSARTGCGHVNHPGGKSEGPQTHLLVWDFRKKEKRTKTTIFVIGLKVF